ncbi:hypothetical protein ANAEL_02993 [Anaerolineales bacterium]|nr:hypothetical protein ANAEL_02993 [Anaerolineales bacterium]
MTFLYILIGVVIGWFIGFLDSNRNMQKKVRAAEFNAEIKIEEAEKRAALAERGFAAANPSQDDPGLLRLKKVNGRHTLELDGVLVPAELTLDMRKRLMELITVFRLWLEPGQTSQSASQPVTPARVSTPPAPDPIREAVYGSPQPMPVREMISHPMQTSPQPAAQPKKPEPDKNITSLSIVQQIDTVLQEHLAISHLAGRGVRLQESIQGGVEVYVGSTKFEMVDDVPDAEIKAAIRSAIAEWEKKYTPGM